MPQNKFGTWVPEGTILHDYSTPEKRNQSSSSNSPRYNDKKFCSTKTFVTPNQYTALQVDEYSGEDVFIQLSDQIATREIQSHSNITKTLSSQPTQPFYIKNITNFTIFKNKLIQLTGINGFTYKASPMVRSMLKLY